MYASSRVVSQEKIFFFFVVRRYSERLNSNESLKTFGYYSRCSDLWRRVDTFPPPPGIDRRATDRGRGVRGFFEQKIEKKRRNAVKKVFFFFGVYKSKI